MIDLGAFLRVPYVETEMGFDLSPDGKRVAFSWTPNGRWEIYEISLEGEGAPRQISRGSGGKFHPRYSSDGKCLAFTVDYDGSENFHIHVHDLISGRQNDLTPDVHSALQSFFAWSPDSTQIAYLSDHSGQFNAYVLTLGDGIKRVYESEKPSLKKLRRVVLES